jgi:ribonuclease P protein component
MPDGPAPLRPTQRLPRASRLRQKRDFTRLKAQGRRLVCGSLILNWLAEEGRGRARLGVVTGRKVGSAVQRNRARRLLREVWRKHQSQFTAPLDMVLVARSSILGRKLVEVENDFRLALRRAGLAKKE